MEKDNILEYINEIKAEIASGNLIDGDYCIIVRTFTGGLVLINKLEVYIKTFMNLKVRLKRT